YHETMTQYIQTLRIEHAQHLLLQTNMTVNEIARACGFMHVTYFIKLFRESTAMTPNAYRRNYGLLLVTTY
ncbi:MAG: helix-turn-helix transcriptional regulator, partial [Capsulimonas sp.]|uniref:helix-turn-helix transcriptional regulator n=1 Tax=Capsulimonas sp. TaxID=2494211 RepID=UPI003265FB63